MQTSSSSLKDFEVIKTLGSGSYSCVYKVRRISDGQEYALKKVKIHQLKPKEKENALNEVRILASINDPSIIGYNDAFFDDASQSLCIIMEYAGGGDLLGKTNEHKKNGTFFSEETIWKYIIQMIKGLRTLHSMKILHRDLKCANVFVTADQNAVKLGDLNVSKVAKKGLVYTQTGTPYYASPEVWRDEPYDMKSDIWSLGCVVYEMLALKPPFRANDMDGLYKKVQKGIFEKIPTRYSTDLSTFTTMCLSIYPSSRPSCDQLLNNSLIQKRMGVQVTTKPSNKAQLTDLLGTIKMPRNINMKALADKLPKSNYNANINAKNIINKSFDFQSNSIQHKDVTRLSLDVDNRVIYAPNNLKRASSSNAGKRISSASIQPDREIYNKSPLQINKKQPVRGVSLDVDDRKIRISGVYQAHAVGNSNSNATKGNQDYAATRKPNYPSVSNVGPKKTLDVVQSSSKDNLTPYQRVANSILKNNILKNYGPSSQSNKDKNTRESRYSKENSKENIRENRENLKPPSVYLHNKRPNSNENNRHHYSSIDDNKKYSVGVDRDSSSIIGGSNQHGNVPRRPSSNSNNGSILKSLDNVDRYNLRHAYNYNYNHHQQYNPSSYLSSKDHHSISVNHGDKNKKSSIKTNHQASSVSQKVIKPLWMAN